MRRAVIIASTLSLGLLVGRAATTRALDQSGDKRGAACPRWTLDSLKTEARIGRPSSVIPEKSRRLAAALSRSTASTTASS